MGLQIMHKSGFDPETGICWDFQHKGERHFSLKEAHKAECPVCAKHEPALSQLAFFGRCRSGTRWFWSASAWGHRPETQEDRHGLADTEDEATSAALQAILEMKDRPLMKAIVSHQMTSHRLKTLNAEKRQQRPPADGSDANIVEYLYAHHSCWDDGNQCACRDLEGSERILYHTVKYPIRRKTKQQIFYDRNFEYLRADLKNYRHYDAAERTGRVKRQEIELERHVWARQERERLYASPDDLLADCLRYQPDKPSKEERLATIRQRKAEMAAAHPDVGGSNEAFIKARRRYEEALASR
jgi:hypothetical protein